MPLNPTPNYPAALDALPDPTQATYTDDDGYELDLLLQKLNGIVEALEAKLGTGASTAAANTVLRGTGAGATAFGQIVNADIANTAAITANKLHGGGVPSRVLATNDGINVGALQVSTAMLAANAVTQIASAVGTTNPAQTTATAFVDIPEMSVTLTTGGGDLLVWFSSSFFKSGGTGYANFGLSLDGAAEVARGNLFFNAVSESKHLTMIHRFSGVSAAAHTVKARWFTTAGTTLDAFQTHRTLIFAEVKR